MMSKLHVFVLISTIELFSMICGELVKYSSLSREKRFLIWQPGASRIQVITGFGIPVDLRTETVIIGTVIKGNYYLPSNASQLIKPYITYERKKRSATRWDMYNTLSQLLEMRGLGGKSCILRAICETARTPLEKNYSLFHELIHALFTPTTTNEKTKRHADGEYYAAQMIGEQNGNCDGIFRDCSTSLIDMFTLLADGSQIDSNSLQHPKRNGFM